MESYPPVNCNESNGTQIDTGSSYARPKFDDKKFCFHGIISPVCSLPITRVFKDFIVPDCDVFIVSILVCFCCNVLQR